MLLCKHRASAAFSIAAVYAYRNQRDEAFEWLDRAYGMHDAGPFWAKVEPLLKNCTATRDIPRFLTKENLPA